jgi:dihydrofolate synthase/folylpolyglutamate synthase
MALTYRNVIANLEARGIMPNRPPSLEVTRKGLEDIGFNHFFKKSVFQNDIKRSIIVAGTNGKGSVCATLERLLSSAGARVGLYTSPHLIETTERIRVGCRDISQSDFIKTFEVVNEKTAHLSLTHFEMLTLMTAWYFLSGELIEPVNHMIWEVGLGGTWDSTNAIPHGTCVITRLGLDHQNILGKTLIEIAANKFGVVCNGATVVHIPLDHTLYHLAQVTKTKTNSKWLESAICPYEIKDLKPVMKTPWGETAINLFGERGVENTSLALKCFEMLGFNPADHLKALEQVYWPGRMEQVENYRGPGKVFLSGDHNPQGIESLISILKDFNFNRIFFLVGVGVDKDCDAILQPLFNQKNAKVFLTETPFKGLKISQYGKWLAKASGVSANPWLAFLEMLKEMNQESDLAIVTGSLYLVGEIKKHLHNLK